MYSWPNKVANFANDGLAIVDVRVHTHTHINTHTILQIKYVLPAAVNKLIAFVLVSFWYNIGDKDGKKTADVLSPKLKTRVHVFDAKQVSLNIAHVGVLQSCQPGFGDTQSPAVAWGRFVACSVQTIDWSRMCTITCTTMCTTMHNNWDCVKYDGPTMSCVNLLSECTHSHLGSSLVWSRSRMCQRIG